jgi:Tol biopolymer transport system component
MYREEFPLLRWLTSWLPRLLVAGSFALGACDAGDTTAPSAGNPAVSPATRPTGQACVGCPVVSTHILFSSAKVGFEYNADIYAMNPDGTGRKVVFTSEMDDYDPAWSPNYTRLGFSRRHGGYLGQMYNGLWTIGYDGLGLFRVTTDSSDKGPAWSKTNRIAFYSTRETEATTGTNEIYTINPDGTGLTRLTNNIVEDRDPAWSPDGSKIVFASDRAQRIRGKTHLYVMNADGTGVKQLTFGSGEDQPAWSPDGSKIAYHVKDGLYTMNADGSNVWGVISAIDAGLGGATLFFTGQPAWSPDGKTLAWVTDNTGRYSIHSISYPDLGLTRLLTPQGVTDQYPAWN